MIVWSLVSKYNWKEACAVRTKTIINMAGKLSSVLRLYCILFAIPVCYPAEDSGILPESDVIKGSFNKNGFHRGRDNSVACFSYCGGN